MDISTLQELFRKAEPKPLLGASKEELLMLRVIVSCLAAVAQLVILCGGISMKRMRSYDFAWTAAILAVIPCISPFVILGIPIGFSALKVLRDDEVRKHFS